MLRRLVCGNQYRNGVLEEGVVVELRGVDLRDPCLIPLVTTGSPTTSPPKSMRLRHSEYKARMIRRTWGGAPMKFNNSRSQRLAKEGKAGGKSKKQPRRITILHSTEASPGCFEIVEVL